MTTWRNGEGRQYKCCRALIHFPCYDGFRASEEKGMRQYEKLPQLRERRSGKCNLIDTNYGRLVGDSTPPIIFLSEISYILFYISQCLFILLALTLSLLVSLTGGYYICFGAVSGLNSVARCVSVCHSCNNTAVRACNDNTYPYSSSLTANVLLMITIYK